MESTEKIVASLTKRNVLILGDVMMTSYCWSEGARTPTQAPLPIIYVLKKDCRFGAAAKVALTIRVLGAKPILFKQFGDEGKKLLQRLYAMKISKEGIFIK